MRASWGTERCAPPRATARWRDEVQQNDGCLRARLVVFTDALRVRTDAAQHDERVTRDAALLWAHGIELNQCNACVVAGNAEPSCDRGGDAGDYARCANVRADRAWTGAGSVQFRWADGLVDLRSRDGRWRGNSARCVHRRRGARRPRSALPSPDISRELSLSPLTARASHGA